MTDQKPDEQSLQDELAAINALAEAAHQDDPHEDADRDVPAGIDTTDQAGK